MQAENARKGKPNNQFSLSPFPFYQATKQAQLQTLMQIETQMPAGKARE